MIHLESSGRSADSSPRELDRVPTFLRGAGLNLVGRIVGQGCQLLAHVAVARFYGPAAFGLFALGWTIFRLGSFLAPLGLEYGVVRYGSMSVDGQPREVREVVSRTLGLAALAGAGFGTTLFVVAPALSRLFQEPGLTTLLRIFAVGLPLAAVMRVGVAATRVSQKMSYSVLSEYLLQPVAFLGLVVAAYLLGQNVTGGAAAAVGSYGLAAALALYFTFRLFPAGGPSALPPVPRTQLLAFSVPAALAGVLSLAILWADRLFLGYYMSAEAVGIYQASSQSALLFTVATAATSTVLAPLIVDLHGRGETARLSRLFSFSVRWSLVLTAPVFLVVFFAPATFLHVLFGVEYTAGSTALRVLLAGQLVSVATGTAGYALVMVGRQRQWLFISAFAFTANLLLNWALIPRFGMVGAALATTVATVLLFVPPLLALRRLIGLRLYYTGWIRLLIPAAGALIVLWILDSMLVARPYATLATHFAVAGIVFFAGMLLHGLRPQEVASMKELRKLVSTGVYGGEGQK